MKAYRELIELICRRSSGVHEGSESEFRRVAAIERLPVVVSVKKQSNAKKYERIGQKKYFDDDIMDTKSPLRLEDISLIDKYVIVNKVRAEV